MLESQMAYGWERPMIRIPLRVSGVDLDDDVSLDLLAEHLSDLTWTEWHGDVLATLHTSSQNPVAKALEAARRICHIFPDAEVGDVDPELVSISDIAHRLGLSREAVRLWVEGRRGPGDFPRPLGAVSGGKSKVWEWSRVHDWVRDNFDIGDNETHLSYAQIVELNGFLARIKHPIDDEWEIVSSYEQRVRSPNNGAENVHDLILLLNESVLAGKAKSHMVWALNLVEDGASWVARYGNHYPGGMIEVSAEAAQVEELT
ncbi:hypothetical protein GA0070617_0448 [Micromonospora yangpuensis]|uniref:DNA-binding protein n=2 Tax=Micromonospora yangpuensis TaxID=683228 RepID=A0A1C6TYZ9_9ACTN|nr:hypothetical protein GA0070617_0448 [Micromonospora yangpuensis]